MTSGIRKGAQRLSEEQKRERARIANRKRYLIKTGRQPDGKLPRKYTKRKHGQRTKTITFNFTGIQCDLALTGVYAIQNTNNHKIYIGSAAKSFKSRWKQHRIELNGGTHHSKHLQAAWNKYGEQAFIFTVLEITTPQDCVNAEQQWIDTHNSANDKHGYNICPVAGSTLGFKMPPEIIKRLAERNRGNKYGQGRIHSPETKDKIRRAITGTKHSPQHNQNLGNSHKGKKLSAQHKQQLADGLRNWRELQRIQKKRKKLTLF